MQIKKIVLILFLILFSITGSNLSSQEDCLLNGYYIYLNTEDDEVPDNMGLQLEFSEGRYVIKIGQEIDESNDYYINYYWELVDVTWGLFQLEKTEKIHKIGEKKYPIYIIKYHEIGHNKDIKGFGENSKNEIYFTDDIYYEGNWSKGFVTIDDNKSYVEGSLEDY